MTPLDELHPAFPEYLRRYAEGAMQWWGQQTNEEFSGKVSLAPPPERAP
jgi:hypothetical protein